MNGREDERPGAWRHDALRSGSVRRARRVPAALCGVDKRTTREKRRGREAEGGGERSMRTLWSCRARARPCSWAHEIRTRTRLLVWVFVCWPCRRLSCFGAHFLVLSSSSLFHCHHHHHHLSPPPSPPPPPLLLLLLLLLLLHLLLLFRCWSRRGCARHCTMAAMDPQKADLALSGAYLAPQIVLMGNESSEDESELNRDKSQVGPFFFILFF